MRVKLIDMDIRQLDRIDRLAGYDAVEILFRSGRDPLGRARIPCDGDSIELEEIQALINDLPQPTRFEPPDGPLPTVTVAVCTRNRSEGLTATLRSLAYQEYPADEVLVIDNGCNGNIQPLVESILPDARYIQERRPGLDFARNRAVSSATGDIIAFLDDDAEADPYWVRSVAECFAAFPKAAGVTGLTLPLELETRAQELFEANGGYARGFLRRVLPRDGKRLLGLRVPLVVDTTDVGTGCNMAFRRAVLQQLHGFDEALDTGPSLPGGGDLDMLYRVTKAGHELVYEPRALVHHCHRRSKVDLRTQLTGHQRAFISFLVKTICTEQIWGCVGVTLFLAWRLTKAGYRMIRGMLGYGVLPISFLVYIFGASFVGLGSYHASKWRIRGLARESGRSPSRLVGQTSELWRYRELVWNLTTRDLKVKYQRSWLGFFWTLLNPLITVAVLVAIFSYVVRLPIVHYWAFLISGYFVWNFFSQTLNGGVQAAVGNAYLTRSSYFPQEVLVVSSALARLLEFLGELMIVLFLLAIFHHKGVPLSFAMVLPLTLILFLLAIGISFPLVTLTVYYNDAVQAIPLATMLLFYASPVFYNIDLVPENIRTIYLLNPMASLLNVYHVALYEGKMPDPSVIIVLAALALGLALLGYTVFNGKKREFAEIV